MKQTKQFKRTAFNLSAKSMVSLMLLLIAMIVPQEAWAGACAYTPGCASLEDMQVHLNGTNGNFNGSANNEVVASLKFNYWLDIFNYDGDNGFWDRDLTMKIDGQTLTFYSDYACTTKVSTDYSTVLQGVWGVFGDSNEDHTIGKNKSGSGNKAYFETSSGLKGYINIYNYYAASNKWTTMKVEVFIYDLYGHKVSVCGTYKRPGKSDIAYDYVFYLGGCPRPKNVTTSQSTTQKEVTISWQKETYSIPASDATGETRVKAYNVIDNGNWGVYRNDNYTTSIQTVGNTATSAADNSASCSSSPYTYNVCYEPKATYGSNGTSLKGDVTSQRGISGSSSITLTHVWSNSGSLKDAATCTAAAVYYQKCIYCGSTSDDNHTYPSGSALGHGSTGYNESYSWTGNAYNDASQDTKACTFTLTCKKCSTKVVNGASLTCIKTAHVDATCRATGSTTYQATGSYTAANSAYNYSATKTNVYTIAALGHGSTGYTESYVWTGNAYNDASKDTKACIFTLTCKNCSTKVVNGASLTCIKTAHVDATCTATGITTYQATGSYTAANSAYNYSATKIHEYPIAALGHGSTGYTPTYTWGGTYDAATCTFTLQCGRCDGVVFNDNITTSKVDANHKDATCTEPGNERWTATGYYSKTGDATYNGTAQTKDYTIPTSHHTFTNKTLTDDPVEDGLYAYACDYGCGERNDAHVIKNYDGEGNNLELTKDGEGNYTAYSVDIVDGKSFFTPVPFTSKIVNMNRTFIVGHTSDDIVPATVMLPFSIEAEALAPPARVNPNLGYIFYEFNSIIRNPETDKWEAIMTRVPDDDDIQAYTPYILVMMNLDVNHFDFGWNYNTMTFSATPAASDMITTDAETGWTFVGLNETKRWEEGDQEIGKAYGIAGKDKDYDDYSVHRGDFVKIAAGASAKPGRCYLLKEGGILSNARGMTRAAEEEELPAVIQLRLVGSSTQGIGTINTETGEMTIEGWYDLNGNKIEEPSKGGVYIHNNKKVMLK